MRMNLFLDRSKILIKHWIIFFGAWVCINLFQLIMRFELVGYSVFARGSEDSTAWEHFTAVLILGFCAGWWIAEIYQGRQIIKEFSGFAQSIEKTDEIRETLYKLKLYLVIILVANVFCIICGFERNLNWIIVLLSTVLKIYYAYQYKTLINQMNGNVDVQKEAKIR